MQLLSAPLLAGYIHFRQPSTFTQIDPRPRPASDEAMLQPGDTLLQRKPAVAARLIWVRAVLTSLGLCLALASINKIAISELDTVFSSRAYLIGILCWIFLREVFGWRLQVAAGKHLISCGLVA
jgi:hypothetical protein